MLPADEQVDAGDGQHDGKQDDGRRRRVGGVAAAVAVQHIVDIAHDGVHLRRVQIHTEQCHRIAVGLERTDETGDLILSVVDGQLTITPYKERKLP